MGRRIQPLRHLARPAPAPRLAGTLSPTLPQEELALEWLWLPLLASLPPSTSSASSRSARRPRSPLPQLTPSGRETMLPLLTLFTALPTRRPSRGHASNRCEYRVGVPK